MSDDDAPKPIYIRKPEGGWEEYQKLMERYTYNGWGPSAEETPAPASRDEDREDTLPGITIPEKLTRDTPQAAIIDKCLFCRKNAPMRNANLCMACYTQRHV